MADGQLLSLSQDTSTASGSPPSFAAIVNHPLGRKPQAILQGLANCFCFIAIDPKQPNGIDLTKQIQLDFLSGSSAAFPTNLVVPLWFF